jgi:hypothetical protein
MIVEGGKTEKIKSVYAKLRWHRIQCVYHQSEHFIILW